MTATFCQTCGRPRSESRFCNGCGRDFESPPPVPVQPPYEPAYAPTAPAYQPPPQRRGGTRLWIPLTLIVLLLGAGGGAFALVQSMGKKQSAQPSGATPSLTVRTAAQPTRAARTPAASPRPSAAASPSPSVVPTPSPSSPARVVGLGPGVGSVSGQVEVVLTHYFQGINARNYAEYASSRTAQGRANEPEPTFDSGYATTTDSGMTLTSLAPAGHGDQIATVAFTSRQSPSDSVDNSACNDWTLYFYLVQNGAGYLIAPSPPGYDSTYTDC